MKITFSNSLLFVALGALALTAKPVSAKLGSSLSPDSSSQHVEHQEEPKLHLREGFVSTRDLQELEFYGGKPDPERLPLGLCEGDCDDDTDVSTRYDG